MRMREYKTLLYVASMFMLIFVVINYLFISKLTSELKQVSTSLTSNKIEVAIKDGLQTLPIKYKSVKENGNYISKEFIKLLSPSKNIKSYEDLWNLPKNWIVGNQLFNNKSLELGNILDALQNSRIILADIDSRGTQLKLLLTLEGDQKAVFKPQWYKLNHIINGPVYSGKDRYNAEIIAFYLAGILDFRSVPFSVERCIKLNSEILPVATGRLRITIDIRNGSWCVYGVCHYCRYNDSVCESSKGLCGALIMHVPEKLKLHRSPWQRKYKGNTVAEWQIKNDYCIKVKQVLKINRLLDLIDVSIFDFLIQNGDRHHYETINNRILFVDNGKAFGNPTIHHLDILAPLYQCCIIRLTTWNNIQQLTGGKLKNILLELTKDNPLLTTDHLNALEERLLMVFSAVELCMKRSYENDSQNLNTLISSSEIEWIHKLYPQPKLILHNFYQVLRSELDSVDYKPVISYKSVTSNKKCSVHWDCVIKLKWPTEIKFNAVSNTKQDASNKAALKVLYWLKSIGKITSKGVPFITNKHLLAKKNVPFEFNVDLSSNKNINTIISIYQNYALSILENIDTNEQKYLNFGEQNAGQIFDLMNRDVEKLKRNLRKYTRELDNHFPILKYRDTIIKLINNNQVVIIKGEPGCGKSTQVPQYILDNWINQNENEDCQIIVTQPRRIAAISLAEHVSKERKEQLGKTIGYQVRLESVYNPKMCVISYCTTGILLKRLQNDPMLLNTTHVILDEAHERDTNTDMLMMLLRRAISNNSRLKLIIMSATMDTTLFQSYYNKSCVLYIPGFTYPVKQYFLEDIQFDLKKHKQMNSNENPSIDADEIANFIKWIHCNKKEGAILCFLPGWDEINKVRQCLDDMKHHNYVIFLLHSRLSNLVQKKIFTKPSPGIRKIILATNIAETSVTIDDVVYVVDTGVHKEKRFHTDKGIENVDCYWISQSNVDQRAGRAGRVQPGESYHLFTKEKYQNMNKYSLPEIIRVSLSKIVLDSKVYSHDLKAAQFFKELPTSPDEKAINQAISELTDLNMLNADEQLTPLGKIVSLFALSPKLSKVLIYSYFFRCVYPILDIITILSSDVDIFSKSLQNKKNAREIKKEVSESSDHLALAKIICIWREKFYNNVEIATKWCEDNSLNHKKMVFLEKLRKIHYQYLDDLDQKVKMNISNKYSLNESIIKGILLSGLGNILYFRNRDVIKGKLKKGNSFIIAKNGYKAALTSDSVNYKCKEFESPFLIYANDIHSLIKRITLIRETSSISPLIMLLFMNNYQILPIGQDEKHTIIKLGKDIKILSSVKTLETIQKIASILDVMVNYFIKYGPDERYSDATKSMTILWDAILNELDSLSYKSKFTANEAN